jgi:hypothetical protein
MVLPGLDAKRAESKCPYRQELAADGRDYY